MKQFLHLKPRLLTLALIPAFGLASSSLACPVKPGFMIKVNLPMGPNMRPVCGPAYEAAVKQIRENFRKAGKPLPASAWIEVYAMHTDSLDWMRDSAAAVVRAQKMHNMKEAAKYDIPEGMVNVYKNYATNATLFEYTMYYLPDAKMTLTTYMVYIGNY